MSLLRYSFQGMIWFYTESRFFAIALVNQLLSVSQPWQGYLELEFTQAQGNTHLAQSFVQAPLKVQRPFYPEGSAICHVVTLHTAGGMVGGDRLSSKIQLHPQAQALMTTAAAGKIYRSNGSEAQQSTHIQLAEGACLEWLPQENIVFDGAIYQQDLRVELATDAIWIGWDLVRFGRSARNERFASGRWRSRTEVWQGDRLIWVDPQYLQGGSAMLDSPHGLAGCPVVGSFVLIGRSISREQISEIRERVSESRGQGLGAGGQESDMEGGIQQSSRVEEQRSSAAGDTISYPLPPTPYPLPPTPYPLSPTPSFVVTRLMSGVLCRYRGHSTAEARRGFMAVWDLLRAETLDRPMCRPRIWY